jgi:DNA-binding NarL/FixJ family response regulator
MQGYVRMAVHVLIVDADTSAAAITGAIVKRIEPQASVVYELTPERAWLNLQQMPPDVLIIDPASQGPSGTLLIQLCKKDHPSMRVVVLASLPTPGLRATVGRLGIDVYLEKPATLPKLVDKLGAALRVREDGVMLPPTVHSVI